MIAPTSEGIDADAQIESMGRHSLALWPKWLAELPVPVFYRDHGTLLLWHREDAGEALRVERALASRQPQTYIERIEGACVGEMEPALETRFCQALYVAGEAQLDNRSLLEAVALALVALSGAIRSSWRKTDYWDMELSRDADTVSFGRGDFRW
jgi:glycine oxidase